MRHIGLLLGMVAVIAFMAGSTMAAEGPGGPGGARPTMGELTKIDGKILTISVKRDGAATVLTATVDDATEIFNQVPAKLETLKVGDRVRLTKEGKMVGAGEITKIEGKVLTLKSRRGEDQAVTVDDATTITVTVKAKFEDLKVGQFVSVAIKDGKATRVEIRPAPTPRPTETPAK